MTHWRLLLKLAESVTAQAHMVSTDRGAYRTEYVAEKKGFSLVVSDPTLYLLKIYTKNDF